MGNNQLRANPGQALWVQEQRELGPVAPVEPTPIAHPAFEINLGTLLRILSDWRWVILAFVALGFACGLLFSMLTTPLYRSTATLEMNPPQVQVLAEGTGGQPMIGNDQNFLATQYGLLQSRALAQRVAQSLNLGTNPAFVPTGTDRATGTNIATDKLIAGMQVQPVPESRLVKISYISENPAVAARVVNAYADNFINSNLERRYESSAYARRFLQTQIDRLKGELETGERRLVAYAQRENLVTAGATPGTSGSSTPVASTLTASSLGSLNDALSQATTRRIAAEERYRQSLAVTQTAEVNERVAPLRVQLSNLQSEYQQKSSLFRDDYPDMVRLRQQIASVQQLIDTEMSRTSASRSNTFLADFRAAQNEERLLQQRVNSLRSASLSERARSIPYNILQRELDTNRGLYDALLQRYREIGIAGGVGVNTVSIVDRAEPSGVPVSPNLPLNLILGTVLGFALGFLGALGLEILNDVIKSKEDVRAKLGLAPLGVIPIATNTTKSGTNRLIEELSDRTSPLAEAYFSLLSSLQFSTDHGMPRSLLVTSSRAAEGKSSTTLALAQSMALLGNRVLLIDADLRKPAFVTQVEATEGFSKLLTNSEPFQPSVLKTEIENLWLLPCGPLPPNPAELLASPRVRAIIDDAMQHYDQVIIDGPPVLGLADAPMLAAVCSGTLLVVEASKTRRRAVLDAIDRLRASGTHLVGVVLTKYKQRAHSYGYGYGYGYEAYNYGSGDKTNALQREIRLVPRLDD